MLEERAVELKLVNVHHVKILPGRHSDVLDAERLAHGLLRGSFVPPPAIRELRDLTRYRKRLIQARTAEGQRIQQTLGAAGIKLDSVASDGIGHEFLMWATDSAEGLQHFEQASRDCDRYSDTHTIGGVRFVEGHDPDGIRVVIAHPSPEQRPRSMLDPRFYS